MDTEKFYNKLKCPMKSLYLHQDGYHKRKKFFYFGFLFLFLFLAHDDLGADMVFEEIEMFIKNT